MVQQRRKLQWRSARDSLPGTAKLPEEVYLHLGSSTTFQGTSGCPKYWTSESSRAG
jgi:hypothetical protein